MMAGSGEQEPVEGGIVGGNIDDNGTAQGGGGGGEGFRCTYTS